MGSVCGNQNNKKKNNKNENLESNNNVNNKHALKTTGHQPSKIINY